MLAGGFLGRTSMFLRDTASHTKRMKGVISKKAHAVLMWYYSNAEFLKCAKCNKTHGITLIKVAPERYICTECESSDRREDRLQFTRRERRELYRNGWTIRGALERWGSRV